MSIKKFSVTKFLKQAAVVTSILALSVTVVNSKSQELPRTNTHAIGTYSGQFLAANLALSNRDYRAAADFLMRMYLNDSEDLIVIESLFVISLINGEHDKARLFAQKYHSIAGLELPQSGHHYLSKLFLASYHLKNEDYKQAISHVEEGDDFMISEMSYNLLSTWINFADENPLAAVDSLNKLNENSFHKIYHLINSAILAEMQDRQKDADNFYNNALLLGGTKLDLIDAYGRFLERTGREKQAFALYEDFENRAGKHPLIAAARERLAVGEKPEPFIASPKEAMAYNFYHIANIYYGAGNYDESLNYARLAQFLAPKNPYILDILSRNFENMEKYIFSNEILELFEVDSPFYVKAQSRIANNLEVNGQNGLAMAKMKELIKTSENNEEVTLAYADMLKRNELYTDSIEFYSGVIDSRILLTINDAGLLFNRGVSHAMLKNWPSAEADFQQTLKLEPNHAFALNYLGYSWVDKGVHLDEGLDMIGKALLVQPQNAFIIDSLGWAYYKLERYEEARIELERAQLVSPSNADISDHLGDVYWKLGRKLEARFRWEHAKVFKSPEINYDDVEFKLQNGLDALDLKKAKLNEPLVKADNG
ncbi:MAG: tetratricopeptide repeat protein [Hyphomicrobiales bacterium]